MELWIPATIAGAFLQNARSALQKHLKDRLTTLGATYVRFLYAWPLAVTYVWGLQHWGGFTLPVPNTTFWLYCILGSLTQFLFTALLIHLFSLRNFAVGTTYSKTEVVQVAVFGFLILGDEVSWPAAGAIAIAFLGVVALSMGQTKMTARTLVSGLTGKTTLLGLTCGAFLGGSVVFFRGAALSLEHDSAIMAAAYTVAAATILQTLGIGLYLAYRERQTLRDVFVHWKGGSAVGVAGGLASIAWFTAFTLENAAYVRALGQIELVFTFAASVLIFRERSTRLEVTGIVLIVLSILILILGR